MPLRDGGVQGLRGEAVANCVRVDCIRPHLRETGTAVAGQEVNDLNTILSGDLSNAAMHVEPGVCNRRIDHQWKNNQDDFDVLLRGELPKRMEILDQFVPGLRSWAMYLMVKIQAIGMQQVPHPGIEEIDALPKLAMWF